MSSITTQQCGPLSPALAADSTSGSFPARVPIVGPPPGGITLSTGSIVKSLLKLVPYAVGSAGNTFSMRLLGWQPVGPWNGQGTDGRQWIPLPLLEVACTLGTTPGIVGLIPDNTHLYASTLTLAAWVNANFSAEVINPGNNYAGYLNLDVKGCPVIEPIFQITASVTAMNVLVGGY